MANLSGQPELDDASLETAEARMRRALGDLEANGPANGRAGHEPGRARTETRMPERHSGERPRARFVQDGDVPVTVLNRSRPHEAEPSVGSSRLGMAEAALASERTARLRAERALNEAQAAVHDLQTKLGHRELARQELAVRLETEKAAFEAERTALQERERTLTEELAAERRARAEAVEGKAARRSSARHALPADADALANDVAAPVKRSGADQVQAKRLGRPKSRTEAQPVKWWLGGTAKK